MPTITAFNDYYKLLNEKGTKILIIDDDNAQLIYDDSKVHLAYAYGNTAI